MITYLIVTGLGVIIFIVYRFQEDISSASGYAIRKAAPLKSALLPVPQAYKSILQQYFPYYQQLSLTNKNRFERKVMEFIFQKQFIPRQLESITMEMRVMIAASAVQLTFGLPQTYLSHFDKILVYANDYYSNITKQYHKGEVNPRFGIIVLSWRSFVEGYADQQDSRNLGLHEMAHALRLEIAIRSEEIPPFDESLLRSFDEFAHRICGDPAYASQTVFRPYACTNVHEFFSVAVETFFERPQQFQSSMPELYKLLAGLLNQDPLQLKAA